jgi:hypothetical protein
MSGDSTSTHALGENPIPLCQATLLHLPLYAVDKQSSEH